MPYFQMCYAGWVLAFMPNHPDCDYFLKFHWPGFLVGKALDGPGLEWIKKAATVAAWKQRLLSPDRNGLFSFGFRFFRGYA